MGEEREVVYEELERYVFPRLATLESGVHKLQVDGCPQRDNDLRRVAMLEQNVGKIFDKIDGFSNVLSTHETNMVKSISGLRLWVLGGALVVVVSLCVFFAVDYANDINRHLEKKPISVMTK